MNSRTINHFRSFRLLIFFAIFSSSAFSQKQEISWGDQGNGTYINPILNADYSDPDAIRVGDDYYMVCSEFHFMGMPVLHSKDLVNWTIIGQIYHEFRFAPEFDTNDRYAGGSWAPSIRYHDKKFWVYFCTPDEGLFMTTAEKPEGPWEPLTQVVEIPKWEDPCPFWDDNGQGYLARSIWGAGPIIVHKLSPDGKKLMDDGVTVYTGPVAEGPKPFKRNGYYYISLPEGGVGEGWQTILRSKNIYGPYEKKVVLETGSTHINGPHQGALVDTPDGEWWFLHFQLYPPLGRVVHLQPAWWKEDWPVIGVDIDRNGIGEPVYSWQNPYKNTTVAKPQATDDFDSPKPGLQWAWNHNPVDKAWSLTENPGKLTLHALHADNFLKAQNTLTQKIMGYNGETIVLLDGKKMKEGQKAGLCVMGKDYALVGLKKQDGKFYLFTDVNGTQNETKIAASYIWLKVRITSEKNQNQFSYSSNDKQFIPVGDNFEVLYGHWKGPRIGLYSFNETEEGGIAVFDSFRYGFN
ncbi:MAG TPA: beta-xylosidase [Prolixibacteraceae bacterium]|nr:beta-xylosidase [Prolixibacteraceae bacterium]HCR91029.1 beta-xylosidase [Prolixibacteraceae bacterium]HCU62626.1 beta-xylosidase [Prolixibacteraceae bacterium]